MQTLSEWVRQLVLFAFVAGAVHLLLPTDNMRPYVRFVLGLVLMAVLLGTMLDALPVGMDLDWLLRPGAGELESAAVVERGEAMALAAHRRLVYDDGLQMASRVASLATVVLGVPPVSVDLADGMEGQAVRIVIVRDGPAQLADEEAIPVLARLLGVEAAHITIVDGGGGGGNWQ